MRRISINQHQFTSHAALRPLEFVGRADYARERLLGSAPLLDMLPETQGAPDEQKRFVSDLENAFWLGRSHG